MFPAGGRGCEGHKHSSVRCSSLSVAIGSVVNVSFGLSENFRDHFIHNDSGQDGIGRTSCIGQTFRLPLLQQLMPAPDRGLCGPIRPHQRQLRTESRIDAPQGPTLPRPYCRDSDESSRPHGR